MTKHALRSMHESVRRFASTKRSVRTAKTYGSIAQMFLASLPDDLPERRDVERFLARPLRSGGRASIAAYNQELAALRSYAKFAVKEGIWQADPTSDIAFERGESKEPAVLLVPEVLDFIRAARAISQRCWQARNLALIALLFTVGLRVSEVVRLDVTQLETKDGRLLIVRRKGRRVQNLRVEPRTMHLLRQWLNERDRHLNGEEPALFVSNRGTRFSARSVQRLFERVRKHTGTTRHVTPHTARHSFVTNGLMLGADLTVVSRAAGHESVTTTMRYRHFIDTELQELVGLLGAVVPPELAPTSGNDEDMREAPDVQLQLTFPEDLTPSGRPPLPANDTLDVQENLDDENTAA